MDSPAPGGTPRRPQATRRPADIHHPGTCLPLPPRHHRSHTGNRLRSPLSRQQLPPCLLRQRTRSHPVVTRRLPCRHTRGLPATAHRPSHQRRPLLHSRLPSRRRRRQTRMGRRRPSSKTSCATRRAPPGRYQSLASSRTACHSVCADCCQEKRRRCARPAATTRSHWAGSRKDRTRSASC